MTNTTTINMTAMRLLALVQEDDCDGAKVLLQTSAKLIPDLLTWQAGGKTIMGEVTSEPMHCLLMRYGWQHKDMARPSLKQVNYDRKPVAVAIPDMSAVLYGGISYAQAPLNMH